ncbi:MAG: OmpA family protein [Saprospiraceae bacterium]|nr:OmpA family protein [Saprospiraceae bacterium]
MQQTILTKPYIWIALTMCFIFGGGITSDLMANDDNYFDYLPKYRKFKDHYQIDKIEYRDKRTIVYFRYVVQESGYTNFFGGNHPESWYLRTPPRMRGLEIQFQLLEIQNIKINEELRLETLTHVPEVHYETKSGDVITCQMHFVRVPKYIRMLDLVQGQDGDQDQDRLNCFDIMIKSKDSPILGQEQDATKTEQRFTSSNSVMPVSNNTGNPGNNPAPKPNLNGTYDGSTADPIDYMPKSMSSIEDLSCNERVILPAVHFRDNEVQFSGRVNATKDVRLLARYLKIFPNARMRLHGHTDIHGDAIKNLSLSHDRALYIRRTLVQMGISKSRIEVHYYGGTQPLKTFPNGGDPNRRVEAEVICDGDTSSGPQVIIKDRQSN